jgi:hypothetical protein
MYLSLLEFIYAVKDHEIVEEWLAQAHLNSVLISMMQYDEEILAVVASEHQLAGTSQKMYGQPAISSWEEKQAYVYRVKTVVAPELVLRSFPFGEGEEWYRGGEQTAYLCLQAQRFNNEQVSWLATCTQIIDWDFFWPLSPMPLPGKLYQHSIT